MNALRLRLTTVAVAAASVLTGLTPAQALQMPSSPGVSSASPVTDVQYRRDMRDRPGWYGGHRGYRERRPGYRYHNGYWFPLAAFATGAIIGGAAAANRGGDLDSRHIAWCENRYRTFRASDNTFAPRVGVRAQCISPYS